MSSSTSSSISSPYAKAHQPPHGPGDARPTTTQILHDESLLTLPNRLTNTTILITGATSGLGLEVAKALHSTGAKVWITGRCDRSKGDSVAASIGQSSDAADTNDHKHDDDVAASKTLHPVKFIHMDNADLSSIRDGAARFLTESNGQLNLLICNAGVMAVPTRESTEQGFERQFGVNHLAHFLLFQLVKEALVASSSAEVRSRVVVVASCAHRGSGLVDCGGKGGEFEFDYGFEKTEYDALKAYGQSKTANVYMANELERQFGKKEKKGVHGLSVHPGVILETGLVKHMADSPEQVREMFGGNPTFLPMNKSVEQGAGCILWAAVAKSLEGKGGLYLEDCDVAKPVGKEVEWWDPGHSEWCYDQAKEEKLWSDSMKMVADCL